MNQNHADEDVGPTYEYSYVVVDHLLNNDKEWLEQTLDFNTDKLLDALDWSYMMYGAGFYWLDGAVGYSDGGGGNIIFEGGSLVSRFPFGSHDYELYIIAINYETDNFESEDRELKVVGISICPASAFEESDIETKKTRINNESIEVGDTQVDGESILYFYMDMFS